MKIINIGLVIIITILLISIPIFPVLSKNITDFSTFESPLFIQRIKNLNRDNYHTSYLGIDDPVPIPIENIDFSTNKLINSIFNRLYSDRELLQNVINKIKNYKYQLDFDIDNKHHLTSEFLNQSNIIINSNDMLLTVFEGEQNRCTFRGNWLPGCWFFIGVGAIIWVFLSILNFIYVLIFGPYPMTYYCNYF